MVPLEIATSVTPWRRDGRIRDGRTCRSFRPDNPRQTAPAPLPPHAVGTVLGEAPVGPRIRQTSRAGSLEPGCDSAGPQDADRHDRIKTIPIPPSAVPM